MQWGRQPFMSCASCTLFFSRYLCHQNCPWTHHRRMGRAANSRERQRRLTCEAGMQCCTLPRAPQLRSPALSTRSHPICRCGSATPLNLSSRFPVQPAPPIEVRQSKMWLHESKQEAMTPTELPHPIRRYTSSRSPAFAWQGRRYGSNVACMPAVRCLTHCQESEEALGPPQQ